MTKLFGNQGSKPLRVLPLLLAVLLFSGNVTQPARAEESSSDYTDFSLAELMDMDVVYGASKFEQKTIDAPSSITVLTSEDIRDFGYTNLAEILNSLRGFYTTYDHNYSYVGARGFGRPGDYNSRLLVMIDGNRINENVYASAAVGNDFPLDVSLIERVEVMRGPSSSLYGSSAVFGIVNIITREGRQIDGVETEVRAGSFGRYSGRLTAGGQTEKGTDWVVSATTGQLDGQDRAFPEFIDVAPGGIFQDGDKDQWTRLAASVSGSVFHFESVWNWRKKHIPTAAWETIFNDNRAWAEDNQGFASVWYEGALSENTTLLSRLSFHLYDYAGSYPYDYAEEGEEPWIVINRDNARGRWLTMDNQLTRKFDGGHTLAVGCEWRRNIMQDQAVWDQAPDYWSYLDDRHQNSNWGAYALGEYHLSEKLFLNLGVRYDDYPTFGGTTNPRVAMVAKPGAGSVFKGLYGTAFRAPNAYELYYNDGDETTKANIDLQPETIDTYEFVWNQRLAEQWHGLVSVFNYNISNLIEQEVDPADDLLIYKNSRAVQATGYEIGLVGRQTGGWRERLSYSYQQTEYKGGQDLTNSPQHMLKILLVAPVQTLGSSVGFEVLSQSRRKTVQGHESPAFTLANLTINKELIGSGLQVRGGIHNLFDENYGYPAGVEHTQDILIQDGRSYSLGFTLSR